nr:hypothetical protein Iba_chr03aCG0040 [Ipomoea batatas]
MTRYTSLAIFFTRPLMGNRSSSCHTETHPSIFFSSLCLTAATNISIHLPFATNCAIHLLSPSSLRLTAATNASIHLLSSSSLRRTASPAHCRTPAPPPIYLGVLKTDDFFPSQAATGPSPSSGATASSPLLPLLHLVAPLPPPLDERKRVTGVLRPARCSVAAYGRGRRKRRGCWLAPSLCFFDRRRGREEAEIMPTTYVRLAGEEGWKTFNRCDSPMEENRRTTCRLCCPRPIRRFASAER